MSANENLRRLSEWIDNAPINVEQSQEARLWGRTAKVAEEAGEVISEVVLLTGQNPRKAYGGNVLDLEAEMYDVAITALGAIWHLYDNEPGATDVIAGLEAAVAKVAERALPFGIGS